MVKTREDGKDKTSIPSHFHIFTLAMSLFKLRKINSNFSPTKTSHTQRVWCYYGKMPRNRSVYTELRLKYLVKQGGIEHTDDI